MVFSTVTHSIKTIQYTHHIESGVYSKCSFFENQVKYICHCGETLQWNLLTRTDFEILHKMEESAILQQMCKPRSDSRASEQIMNTSGYIHLLVLFNNYVPVPRAVSNL